MTSPGIDTLPGADVVQSGPLVPTRTLNNTTQNNHSIYHEVDSIPTRFRCQHFDYNYDIAMATICGMYLIFGVVYCLFGEYIGINQL